MKPHPIFADWTIPTDHQLGSFVLKALTVDDVTRDFDAVMESAADIKAANPASVWPHDGMTLDENLIDLAWHQKEFETRRSFAWIIENLSGDYIGCAYVYPSIIGELAADVAWWWRTGALVDRQEFKTRLMDWLEGSDWPPLEYRPALMG